MFLKTITKAQAALQQFKNDERGVTAIEYAIIAVAIAGIVYTVFGNSSDGLGGALQGAMNEVIDKVEVSSTTSGASGN
jgi:pilus assembly protein Flp/PilA